MESNLVRRFLLPEEHQEVMPPSGTEAPTAEEILTIIHWVQRGAPFVED